MREIYVSGKAEGGGDGSIESPMTLSEAVAVASPGQRVNVVSAYKRVPPPRPPRASFEDEEHSW